MNVILKSITLHHFLSFDESIIDLQDRGFCLVSGINRDPRDAAKSNGAGKSTIWNAISFVLTGETLSGLKSNLGNIHFDDGCWVKLDFNIDNHNYTLIRSREDKKLGTNLKVEVDGVDKSGKGLRESEEVLAEILPDLTSELIGSVMILGQGMPNKFTNNSPSKRKEILEHLSKSDFMIQDLRDRVEKRNIELNNQIREVKDNIIEYFSKLSVYNAQLDSSNKELEETLNPINFDDQIKELELKLEDISNSKKSLEEILFNQNNLYDSALINYQNKVNIKNEKLEKIRLERDSFIKEFNERKTNLLVEQTTLTNEIKKLDSITDICPTCGQKIPGAVKPDTTNQKEQLKIIEDKLKILNIEIEEDEKDYKETLDGINNQYNSDIELALKSANDIKILIDEENKSLLNLNNEEINYKLSLSKLNNEKVNYESNIKRIKDSITQIKINIKDLEENKIKSTIKLEDLESHLEVISKMISFLKRDFRGYLLENIISYIGSKAKDYASKIFGSNEIKFELDGNNIEISYCNKDYDNLSGGEKQRVDLIIQFAIRDMLVNYLNFNSNILVLDEITDNLDSFSCDKVLNFITNELNNINSVFIISHHSDELAIPYDSEIIIEKNPNGISEVTNG